MTEEEIVEFVEDHIRKIVSKLINGMSIDNSMAILSMSIGRSIEKAAATFKELSNVVVACTWDDTGNIYIKVNPEKISEDMMVIRG